MGIRHVLGVALLAASGQMISSCVARTAGEDPDSEEDVGEAAQALDGLFEIHPVHSGKCLDVEWASDDDGARLIQWGCHGGDNQRFRVTELDGGYHQITARHSGKCLDVTGASAADGAQIIQYGCHGGPNQQFLLIPKTEGNYTLIARNSGKCLDIAGASQDLRAPLIQWGCHGGPNQQFNFVRITEIH